jgi:hypothetical protein
VTSRPPPGLQEPVTKTQRLFPLSHARHLRPASQL